MSSNTTTTIVDTHIMNQLSEGIILTDKNDLVQFINTAAKNMLNISENAALHQPIDKLLQAEGNTGTNAPLLHSVDSTAVSTAVNVTSSYVTKLISNTGKPIRVKIKTTALTQPNGKTEEQALKLITLNDVTDTYDAQNLSQQLNEDLKKYRQELDDFAYIISHDLKAPIRAIMTLSEWIAEDYAELVDEEGKKQFELLKNRSLRIHNLIDGVLSYSRIGRFVNPSSTFDLNIIIQKVFKELKLDENYHLIIPTDLPKLFADELRTYELFYFLIKNAATFNDKEQKLIKLIYKQEGEFLKFEIQDNGIGIEQRHIDEVFKIFRSLHDKKENLGLGLTLARRIIEMYKGEIELISIPNEGTKVRFSLSTALLLENNPQ